MNGEHSIPSILFSLLVMIESWGVLHLHLELLVMILEDHLSLIPDLVLYV